MSMCPLILICDDDPVVHESLGIYLKSEGFESASAFDGQQALEMSESLHPDLIVLDLMMPKMSGTDVCRTIRQTSNKPIIMLTAKSEEIDRILGLELGADDYITKPFSLSVLRARVNTQLRKQSACTPCIYRDSRFVFDFEQMQFLADGAAVELSKTEQKLLRLLVENQGTTLSRSRLIDRIWTDGAEYVDENALSVTVKRLRDKLGAHDFIQTVYGIGYCWRKKNGQ